MQTGIGVSSTSISVLGVSPVGMLITAAVWFDDLESLSGTEIGTG